MWEPESWEPGGHGSFIFLKKKKVPFTRVKLDLPVSFYVLIVCILLFLYKGIGN